MENIIEKWYKNKQELTKIQKKCDGYKKHIQKYMNKNNINTLNVGNYTITQRCILKECLLKKNIPSDIWNQYSTNSSYNSLYISKK